ncbi:MAG: tryptophan--tRNA ligase, partial [Deltaproteobacteria bacterium]|nr:tryptophan--tRNA ligase [Candidatus Tharpella sp.]
SEGQGGDEATYGFLGYPVLQAADIIIYKANLVPIGVDQLPHVELTREITRRFNHLYGETFPVPKPILTELSKVCGLDGRKMSKSYNNAIHLSDDAETLKKKVSSMVTDVQRARRKDPGDPEKCNLFPLHPLYSKKGEIDEICAACPKAEIGCVDCKKILLKNLLEGLAPIHEKQHYYKNNPQLLDEIIAAGNSRARAITRETMTEVRKAVKLS